MGSEYNSNNTRGNLSFLYDNENELASDKVTVFLADSLVYGRVGSLYGYSGTGGDINSSPFRLENSGGGDIALAKFGSWLMEPSVFLGFYRESYSYPQKDSSSDYSRNINDLDFGVEYSETLFEFLDLSGGIEFNFGFEEYLSYEKNIDTGQVIDTGYVEIQKLNYGNYFSPTLFQEALIQLPIPILISYYFNIERDRKEFSFKYPAEGNIIGKDEDFDNLFLNHKLGISWDVNRMWKVSFSGEYSKKHSII
jgi:hypothetical protein